MKKPRGRPKSKPSLRVNVRFPAALADEIKRYSKRNRLRYPVTVRELVSLGLHVIITTNRSKHG